MPASVAAKLVNIHRAQLQGLTELGSIRRLRALYEQTRAELEDKLAVMTRDGKGQTFTAHHSRIILNQVTDALVQFQKEFGKQLPTNAAQAATLAQKHVAGAIKQLEKRFSGVEPVLQIEQAAVFQKVYRKFEPSLLDRYHRLTSNYPLPTIQRIRKHLALSMLSNESVDQATNRVAGMGGLFAQERWRAERIVRTENSYSYGVTTQRLLGETSREIPALMKRLVTTFDGRTGKDSIKLNGQTVGWDQPFIWMKQTKSGVERVEYMQPPNRPNDRECVVPWRAGYGGMPAKPGPVDPVKPTIRDTP